MRFKATRKRLFVMDCCRFIEQFFGIGFYELPTPREYCTFFLSRLRGEPYVRTQALYQKENMSRKRK